MRTTKQRQSRAKAVRTAKPRAVKAQPAQRKTVPLRNNPISIRTPSTMVFEREEWIGSFQKTGGGGFELISPSDAFPGFDLNPGNPLLFPWLANVSHSFEKYQFQYVELCLVPGNATTSTGRHYLSFDYDWEDPVATTAVDMMTNLTAASGSMWEPLKIKLDIKRLNEIPWRFVSDATRVEDAKRLIYAGYFMVAGDLVDDSVFDLKIKYKVALSNPCLPVPSTVPEISNPETLGAGQREGFPQLPRASGLNPGIIGIDLPVLAGISAPTGAVGASAYFAPSQIKSIQLVVEDAKSGSTPSSYAEDTTLGVRFFDKTGTEVGILYNMIAALGTAARSMLVMSGIADNTTWSVNGGLNRRIARIVMDEVMRAFPATAYIVPYLISTAGQTLTTTRIKAYTEL